MIALRRALLAPALLGVLAVGCGGSSASSNGSSGSTGAATATGTGGTGGTTLGGASNASGSSTGTTTASSGTSSGSTNGPSTSAGSTAGSASSSTSTGSTAGSTSSGSTSAGSGSSGTTGCTSDALCTAGAGTYCDASGDLVGCSQDATDACFTAGAPVPCSAPDTCQGVAGAAVCDCPADTGVVAPGLGCNTATDSSACETSGAGWDKCQNNGGCQVWTLSTDCGGLVCTGSPGALSCVCPSRGGPTFYVDSVNGSNSATGVQNPPQCRYATLSSALSLASLAGGDVIAIGAANGTTMVFSNDGGGFGGGEQFPLWVGAGVTLEGDPSTDGGYLIADNQPGTSAVVMLGGGSNLGAAVLRNLILSVEPGASADTDGVQLQQGQLEVTDVIIRANAAGNTGAGMSGAGPVALQAASTRVSGFGVGIAYGSDGSSELTNVTLDANGQGLVASAGTLVGDPLVVTNSSPRASPTWPAAVRPR